MGAIRFLVPRRDRLPADADERAYLAGIDEVPWHTRIQWTSDGLIIERSENDSGNVFLPVALNGHGEIMLSTASLMERAEPYHLDVELARGTLSRLRNQAAGWEAAGMQLPAEVGPPLAAARERFSQAATHQDDPVVAAEHAVASITSALVAMELLGRSFAAQALAARFGQSGKLATLVACNLGPMRPTESMAQHVVGAFNTAAVPLVWRDIESHEGKRDWALSDAQVDWCRAHGLRICSGPLLAIDRWSLPDWMYLWGEEDLDHFRTCVAEHTAAVVNRYRGKVQLWQCASRLNVKNDFLHDEEQRLRLAVLVIENIRKIDPRTPIVLSIDQPWGAFMRHGNYDLSPLHFADALVRADVGLAGIGLEINYGYVPGGSDARDVLELARQVDRFSMLGLPLLITLTAPSSEAADPRARWPDRAVNYSSESRLSPAAQAAWAGQFLPVLFAKQPVQGVIWNQLADSQPHPFAHGGLFDEADQAKPIINVFERLRREFIA